MSGRTITILLISLALLTTPLATVLAHPWSTPALVDRTTTFHGDDTYVLTIRSDEPFRILNNSFIRVQGIFVNQTPQDVGAMFGMFSYQGACRPACTTTMYGNSLKDDGDIHVESHGPVTFTYQQDPNTFAGIGGLETRMEFQSSVRLPGPQGGSFVTYRFFATIPDADRVRADVHLHLNKPVTVHSEISHAGGFLYTGEDFEPVARADTMPATAMASGELIMPHDPPTDGALLAYLSPSWAGTSAVDLFGAGFGITHNAAAVGSYGIDRPSKCHGCGTWFTAGGPAGPVLLNPQDSGDYRFFTNGYAGAGPSDMYLVGFRGGI